MCLRAGLPLLIAGALLAACGAPATGLSVSSASPTPYTPTPTRFAIVRILPTATATASPTRAPTPTRAPSATPTASATATLAPDAEPAAREARLVAEINRVRAENGLPAYLHSPELSAAARAHSCDLAAHGLISHESSDGRTLADRLAGSDPPWEWPSESIAAGTDDPIAVVAMWMDEPPDGWHRRNILDADQREVGAGYCYAADDPSGNQHYWTADFARRSGD